MAKYTQKEKAEITIKKGSEALPAIRKTIGCLANKDLRPYMSREQERQITESIDLLRDILNKLEEDLEFDDLIPVE